VHGPVVLGFCYTYGCATWTWFSFLNFVGECEMSRNLSCMVEYCLYQFMLIGSNLQKSLWFGFGCHLSSVGDQLLILCIMM
jgi:hypothetical protein